MSDDSFERKILGWCQRWGFSNIPAQDELIDIAREVHNEAEAQGWRNAQQLLIEHGWHGVSQLFDEKLRALRAPTEGSGK